MTGIYLRSEVRRTFRNPRYLIFALAMPLVLFAAFGAAQSHNHLSGITVSAYIMVSMATFGAMSTVFSTGGAIAFERAIGWNRQLRITALTGRAYVAGKGRERPGHLRRCLLAAVLGRRPVGSRHRLPSLGARHRQGVAHLLGRPSRPAGVVRILGGLAGCGGPGRVDGDPRRLCRPRLQAELGHIMIPTASLTWP
jgi:hypothetical protein